jgi:hypothetical protein
MSKVIADISMSLDGYITAPGVDQEHGLGIGGEAIHAARRRSSSGRSPSHRGRRTSPTRWSQARQPPRSELQVGVDSYSGRPVVR